MTLGGDSIVLMLKMLALAGLPSLHGYDVCTVLWTKGASWEKCRQKYVRPLFLPIWFFCLVGTLYTGGGVRFSGIFGSVGLGTLVQSNSRLAVEVFNIGGWLTDGDLVLEALVDFIAVVEWARLWAKGCASAWAPASQESSHVGHAGVRVVSMKDAPLSLPTFATAQFKRFSDCGRAVWCMLPVASSRFLHLVVLCG